jgi:hypothetical protein
MFVDLSETEAMLLDMHLGGLGDDRVRMSMTHLSVSAEARVARVVTCVILGQEHMMRFFLTLSCCCMTTENYFVLIHCFVIV